MIEEVGPWSAILDSKNEPAIISDDFSHDVWMRVSGDFGSAERKLEYCAEIARRLNQWQDNFGKLQAEEILRRRPAGTVESLVRRRFESGNGVPVERVFITRKEFEELMK